MANDDNVVCCQMFVVMFGLRFCSWFETKFVRLEEMFLDTVDHVFKFLSSSFFIKPTKQECDASVIIFTIKLDKKKS